MDKAFTFQDIFSKNFLKSYEFEGVTLNQVLIALLFAFLAGMFIYLIYRVSNNTAMYVNSFGIALVALTMITSLVIMTITSNVILSLGMVGALSIVRFRTAVKEAIDIVYMFWAIATGIAVGAGFYFIASVSVLVIGGLLFAMSKITIRESAFVLAVSTTGQVSQKVLEDILKAEVKKYLFKAKTTHAGGAEYTYEVRLRNNTADFTENLSKVPGVAGVSLVGFKSQNTL
jgi:uncharacterized membrane protein YhiD involved in acid resistance